MSVRSTDTTTILEIDPDRILAQLSVLIDGRHPTHYTLSGNTLVFGKTCLSCGSRSDAFGNLPCGH